MTARVGKWRVLDVVTGTRHRLAAPARLPPERNSSDGHISGAMGLGHRNSDACAHPEWLPG